MTPGSGNISVNGKTLDEYLPLETLRMVVRSPLELTETLGQFDIKINVHGGGYTGQAGAMPVSYTHLDVYKRQDVRSNHSGIAYFSTVYRRYQLPPGKRINTDKGKIH